MKIKIGDTWHVAADGQPIMIQLSDPSEREKVRAMLDPKNNQDRWAEFPPGLGLSKEQMRAWMDEGYTVELAA